MALRRKVAQKFASASWLDVALDHHLALGIGGLRIDRAGLVEEIAAADAIDAAGGRVDEAAHAGGLAPCAPGPPNPGG